jgi:hypothetical protein
MTDEQCLRDDYFWQTFLPLFRYEKEVVEFSEISGIPADHIRQARDAWLGKQEGSLTPN